MVQNEPTHKADDGRNTGGRRDGSGDADNGVDDREKEILVFTALLRLHKSLIKQQKVEQAEAVINQLGLTKCKTSIIGEEKRRVSIGQEMLINPSLLFLDEPTSGLDSTTAQRIILTLWELTRGVLKIAHVTIITLFCGSLWCIQDQSGLLFFYIDFSGFFPLFQAIFTFTQEQEMLAKERSSGMYKLSSYFMSRTIRDQTLDTDLLDGWAQTRRLALGALIMDLKSAAVLGSVIMLSFTLAGGYYVQNVIPFILWIKYASYVQVPLVGIINIVSTKPINSDGNSDTTSVVVDDAENTMKNVTKVFGLVTYSPTLRKCRRPPQIETSIAFVLPGREHECNESFNLGRPPALS
ncbi:ABC transporter G family member 9-like protein [Tanacetum coccineum]